MDRAGVITDDTDGTAGDFRELAKVRFPSKTDKGRSKTANFINGFLIHLRTDRDG